MQRLPVPLLPGSLWAPWLSGACADQKQAALRGWRRHVSGVDCRLGFRYSKVEK